MFAIAARRMGYRVHTLSPDEDTPTGQVADLEVKASYDDLDAVSEFARNVSVVTFEFENVPAPTAEAAGRCAPVRPSGSVLHTTQQRIREKSFLTKAGLPTTPYREVRSLDGLHRALADLGCPAVLKTAAFGYDGKGQFRESDAPDRAAEAWSAIGKQEAVLEAFIDFDREISVVAARGEDGAVRALRRDRESAQPAYPGRVDRAGARVVAGGSRSRGTGALRSRRAGRGGRAVRRVFCGARWIAADQRAGAASAQLRAPDGGRVHHQPVRAAVARGVRAAAGVDGNASAGGDGESAGRFVGEWRARLGRRLRVSRREAASVRKAGAAARPQDGAFDGAESRSGGSLSDGAGRARSSRLHTVTDETSESTQIQVKST